MRSSPAQDRLLRPGTGVSDHREIVTKEKKNLTQERSSELQGKKFKDLPLEKAVKIGSGPHTVIEITDPDLPFLPAGLRLFREKKRRDRVCLLLPGRRAPSERRGEGPLHCSAPKIWPKAYERGGYDRKLDGHEIHTLR